MTKREEDDKTEWIEERIAIAMEGSGLTHYQAFRQAERDWEKQFGNKNGIINDRNQ
jgi:hypothetical protein